MGCGGAVATFVYADWIAQFPMFNVAPTVVLQPAAQGYFYQAGLLYLRNDGTGPVADVATQQMLLYLLTAHLAQLYTGSNGDPASGLVGRINSASEGSVSVASEYPMTPSSAWFQQTPFGAAFWQATAAYRTARYTPGPRRYMGPYPYGGYR